MMSEPKETPAESTEVPTTVEPTSLQPTSLQPTPEPEEKEPAEKLPEEKEPEEEAPEEKEPEEKLPVDESANLAITVPPTCDDELAMTVNQGYWRSWSSDRPETCNKFDAADIDPATYTHLVYSFASISADGHVEPWVGSWDEVDKYVEFNKVKERNPDVKTLIAVTEGVFYGAGMNPVTFHEVAKTEMTRMVFAQSAVSFLELYNFDGMDIDWDTPLDTDRGGGPENYERFVLLVEEIRAAFDRSPNDFLLTVALPPTGWELYDYDVAGLSKYVDWFNLMTFDYHTPKNIPKTIGAHTDLKMIRPVVSELVKDIESTKFVLGMAAYGRTYTLADDTCKELGCPFRSPGLGGCGNTQGFIPFNEINEYIQSESYDELHQDVSSSSMVIVVDKDQMISFDDESTWKLKEEYADEMCLRGTMLWSVDMLPKPTSSTQQTVDTNARLLSTADQSHDWEPCDVCGLNGSNIAESQQLVVSGKITTCGAVASSFHQDTRKNSLSCSIARASFANVCCKSLCSLCPDSEELNPEGYIEEDGTIMSCAEYQSTLTSSSDFKTTDECLSSVSHHSAACCVDGSKKKEEPLSSSTDTACNICNRDGIRHELKSEVMIEHKGIQLSCLDLNSILAKNEVDQSDLCLSTQSILFDSCCYEKCSLCGGRSLQWDKTVIYNSQILSCEEMESMFTLGSIWEDSHECYDMQSAYSESCCFSRPERKCELCQSDVNTHAFVKTAASSLHCVNLANSLAEREEDGSGVCEASREAFSSTCCERSPVQTDGNSYYDWIAQNAMLASSSAVYSIGIISGCLVLITGWLLLS
jgi:chitinase